MILVGGAGSSGSTLLRNILNSQKDIFSGDELNFFNKEKIYLDWKNAKSVLFDKKFSTSGFYPFPGTNLLETEYLWNENDLNDALSGSVSLLDFVYNYYEHILTNLNKKIWIEKTPSNCYCFRQFLQLDNNAKVVHVVRNPYDTVASFMGRGFDLYNACALWFYNNYAALNSRFEERYLLLKYEDLVQNTDRALEKISNFINSEIKNKNSYKPTKQIDAWKLNPTAAIKADSVGRASELPAKKIGQINYVFSKLSLSKIHQKKYLNVNFSFEEMVSHFGYDQRVEYNRSFDLYRQYARDYAMRIYRGYDTKNKNYPIVIK